MSEGHFCRQQLSGDAGARDSFPTYKAGTSVALATLAAVKAFKCLQNVDPADLEPEARAGFALVCGSVCTTLAALDELTRVMWAGDGAKDKAFREFGVASSHIPTRGHRQGSPGKRGKDNPPTRFAF